MNSFNGIFNQLKILVLLLHVVKVVTPANVFSKTEARLTVNVNGLPKLPVWFQIHFDRLITPAFGFGLVLKRIWFSN